MRYVMRDAAGKIVGTFANLQPGHAEEGKPDDRSEEHTSELQSH